MHGSARDQGIPTLLTWGLLGKSLAGDSVSRLRDLFPGIEYYEIEGAEHLVHFGLPYRIKPPVIRFFTS